MSRKLLTAEGHDTLRPNSTICCVNIARKSLQ